MSAGLQWNNTVLGGETKSSRR